MRKHIRAFVSNINLNHHLKLKVCQKKVDYLIRAYGGSYS